MKGPAFKWLASSKDCEGKKKKKRSRSCQNFIAAATELRRK